MSTFLASYNKKVNRRRLFSLALPAVAAAQTAPARDYFVERLAGGFRFTEGPVWLPEGALLFSDIPTNRLLKWSPKNGMSTARDNSGGANGNAVDESGRVYTCEGGARRVTRTGTDNKIEVLAERFEGKRFNAPNDITVRRDGHAWFTDPSFGSQQDTRELPFHGVFHIKPNGQLEIVARMESRPNGITISPNGRTLYVAVSDERSIRAYDIDRSGNTSNPRLVVTGIDGPPDGIKTNSDGNLFVAANRLAIYSPSGEFIKAVELSEKPSNLAFGPEDDVLFVTARTSLYRVRLTPGGQERE